MPRTSSAVSGAAPKSQKPVNTTPSIPAKFMPPKIDLSAGLNVKNVDSWKIGPRVRLSSINPGATPAAPRDGDRSATEKASEALRIRLRELQARLMAEKARSVLVVLQAMDGGGKDGTVKSFYGGLHPAGASVQSFGVPNAEELSHDFLWRIHHRVPERGHIGLFNRSQYEDVLAVPVRNIAPKAVWAPRFDSIVGFERGLAASGTVIVKMMLHISKDEQKARLQARLDRPEKRWKFRVNDLEDRALWDEYQRAYEEVLRRTSTPCAPWYVVPADKKWYRDFATLTILVNTLEALDPRYPTRTDLDGVTID